MILDNVKRWALGYHHRTSRIPQGERVTASVARHIGHAESLLDVGCGDGNNLLRVADLVGAKKHQGVDVVVRPTAIIPVIQYDGLHLPFQDRSFEAVTMIDVLHHCDQPLQVLREIIRVPGASCPSRTTSPSARCPTGCCTSWTSWATRRTASRRPGRTSRRGSGST